MAISIVRRRAKSILQKACEEGKTGEHFEFVKVELERYLFLISRLPDFSQKEWNLMHDALNGIITRSVEPELAVQILAHEVDDAITSSQLDKKWEVNSSSFLSRLNALSATETMAVLDAVEKFWNRRS